MTFLKLLNVLGIAALVAWIVIFIISFFLNYNVTGRDIIDDLSVITSDTTISKWVDFNKEYVVKSDSVKTTYRIGISFIPSKESPYMRLKTNLND